jgi:hypothetical protein
MNTSVKKVVPIKLCNSSRMAIIVIYPFNFRAQLRSQHENTKQHQYKKSKTNQNTEPSEKE